MNSSNAKVNGHFEKDVEGAAILLYMSSGLKWNEFAKKFNQIYPQYSAAANLKKQSERGSSKSTAGPSNQIVLRKRVARKLVIPRISEILAQAGGKKGKTTTKQLIRKAIRTNRHREVQLVESLRKHFTTLPTRGILRERFFSKLIRE